jgi:hypothetical protein
MPSKIKKTENFLCPASIVSAALEQPFEAASRFSTLAQP